MNNQDDGLTRIVLKLTKDEPELSVAGLSNIHPIYEAVIALLKQQLTDTEIATCFSKYDGKEGIKSVLLVDALLEEYKKIPAYTNNLKQMLLSGKPISEITTMAALYMSENKRVQDGQVIQRVGYSEDKYVMKALKMLSPSEVYVKGSEIDKLKVKAKKMQGNRIRGVIAAIGLTALSCFACYEYGKRTAYNERSSTERSRIESLIDSALISPSFQIVLPPTPPGNNYK